jgi:hypothetical protein
LPFKYAKDFFFLTLKNSLPNGEREVSQETG